MNEAIGIFGLIAITFVVILAIAMLFMPFFVWGIYNHVVKIEKLAQEFKNFRPQPVVLDPPKEKPLWKKMDDVK